MAGRGLYDLSRSVVVVLPKPSAGEELEFLVCLGDRRAKSVSVHVPRVGGISWRRWLED